DGRVIRLAIPPLTDERRHDLARMVGRRVEEARVAIRNVRRDGMKELAELEGAGEISEDEHYRAREELQKLTDEYIAKADQIGEQKQAEIMEV
ncbi:MAG: ribosome recycling factor, partial [Chloroflexi bacterium]|nr:ribosome recycling factor [Chloroflexota bacterium]